MPKRTLSRRFEPRYGVSASMVEEEARYLRREVDDYSRLFPADVNANRQKRFSKCKHSWNQLQIHFERLPEREQAVMQCLLFRDFYHILELYLADVRNAHPNILATQPAPATSAEPSNPFSEWLFDPN